MTTWVIITTLEWAIKFLDKWDLRWAKPFMTIACIEFKKLSNENTKTTTQDNNTKS